MFTQLLGQTDVLDLKATPTMTECFGSIKGRKAKSGRSDWGSHNGQR